MKKFCFSIGGLFTVLMMWALAMAFLPQFTSFLDTGPATVNHETPGVRTCTLTESSPCAFDTGDGSYLEVDAREKYSTIAVLYHHEDGYPQGWDSYTLGFVRKEFSINGRGIVSVDGNLQVGIVKHLHEKVWDVSLVWNGPKPEEVCANGGIDNMYLGSTNPMYYLEGGIDAVELDRRGKVLTTYGIEGNRKITGETKPVPPLGEFVKFASSDAQFYNCGIYVVQVLPPR